MSRLCEWNRCEFTFFCLPMLTFGRFLSSHRNTQIFTHLCLWWGDCFAIAERWDNSSVSMYMAKGAFYVLNHREWDRAQGGVLSIFSTRRAKKKEAVDGWWRSLDARIQLSMVSPRWSFKGTLSRMPSVNCPHARWDYLFALFAQENRAQECCTDECN